ncbi:cytochrome ubiquinol oxidase subunit I [Salisediminibacterium halotolerans]|uniref:Cytochrome d ubiquinol oxidase subunit I n=1 Tax=Salisediminibacterium halotolerans TaxID=517425 RepID=A0A1H9TID5_9BACI|nr:MULTISPECIES: cytochrome ubiquinol oxidase subunit I [Salisediminibacterium]RLJ72376.1 cytochrome bd-I ubiquinol oxidase subunit 1 apoprotein [Actinophytocola xinjiangensis]RPE85591.1 cytochrome bd-I ubiquinol oxidase subunit 1 apoprotein [Salisediminibacterium halotolerans]TWG33545.1 cytochrome bd-I ubiquinol oxidase subunit 1 apoprotein [Salisediminibacterium halotolerans]SER96878.1 cytochrome d ubiquinol oxidase subunit I [Salisediminibacterium haloalkalitolerans]GEL08744.1 cytochrome ub
MFEYDPVLFSRILTYVTLGFHVIFATLGVGVPLMIAIAEWMGIKRGDPHYTLMARRWARGFVITVAVGVVTGTAIALQLALLWPNFMQAAGHTIGLPMFMETFAFFFEAIFLGIYLYTWDRFKSKMKHFLLVIPIVIGATASAFFITSVNSFMNAPQGFNIVDGVLTDVSPLAAMFNAATPTKISHVIITCYLTAAFILGMIAAYKILRGNKHVYHKKALHMTMVSALVFAVATAAIGDLSGKYLHEYQPEKLAAAEWHFETETEAPLILGGILTEDNEVEYALEIPFALSILAGGTPDTEVIGLNEYPEDELPPLWVHYFFDAMVFIGMYLAAVSALFVLFNWQNRRNPLRKLNPFKSWMLRLIVLGGPLSMFAIQFGWIFAEVGRQPWILHSVMTTAEGATTSDHVDIMLWIFILLYAVLGVTSYLVLRKMFLHNPVEHELERRGIPYHTVEKDVES